MAWQNPKTNWKAGDAPNSVDLNRWEENVNILGKLDRTSAYGATTGTNAYVVTLIPVPLTYYEGMCIAIKIGIQNTAASTLNVNGLGAKSIRKANGNNVSSGNLKVGSVYTLRYNGVNFILQGEGGEGTAQQNQVLIGKTFTNDEDTLTGTMPNRGAITNTIITQGGQYIIPEGYHSGSGKVTASFANLIAGNVKKGVNIGGVVGGYEEYPIIAGSMVRVIGSIGRVTSTSTSNIQVGQELKVNSGGSVRIFFTPGGGCSTTTHVGYVRIRRSGTLITNISIMGGGTHPEQYYDLTCSAGQTIRVELAARIANDCQASVSDVSFGIAGSLPIHII